MYRYFRPIAIVLVVLLGCDQPGPTEERKTAALIPSWTVSILSMGRGEHGSASGINSAGVVSGWTWSRPTGPRKAVIWTNGQRQVLSPAPGLETYSYYAVDINDSGTVVGYSESDQLSGTAPNFWKATYVWTWSPASGMAVVAFPTQYRLVPAAINNAGIIVGTADTHDWHAGFKLGSGGLKLLVQPGQFLSVATDINDEGIVVGSHGGASSEAARWDAGGTLSLLGAQRATGISPQGNIVAVGASWSRPFIYFASGIPQSGMVELSQPTGIAEVEAISQKLRFAGWRMQSGNMVAFTSTWSGQPADLPLPNQLSYAEAVDVNTCGWIVGNVGYEETMPLLWKPSTCD